MKPKTNSRLQRDCGEWYLQNRGSRKILVRSRNLGSFCFKSQSLVWLVLFLSRSLGFFPSRSRSLGYFCQAFSLFILVCCLIGDLDIFMYQSNPKAPIPSPPPPGQTPGHLTFFKKFVKCPTMWAVYTVKCPTGQSFTERQMPHRPGKEAD